MVLTQMFSLTFQEVKNLSAHHISTAPSFGLFYKFCGDFRVYLGINSFLSKIYGNRKF